MASPKPKYQITTSGRIADKGAASQCGGGTFVVDGAADAIEAVVASDALPVKVQF